MARKNKVKEVPKIETPEEMRIRFLEEKLSLAQKVNNKLLKEKQDLIREIDSIKGNG